MYHYHRRRNEEVQNNKAGLNGKSDGEKEMEISEKCDKEKKIFNGSEPWMGAGRKNKTCGGEWSSSK